MKTIFKDDLNNLYIIIENPNYKLYNDITILYNGIEYKCNMYNYAIKELPNKIYAIVANELEKLRINMLCKYLDIERGAYNEASE